MSLKENFQKTFNPVQINQQEISEAHKQEELATAAFLEGKMSLEEFRQSLKETHPLTKINLRKIASQ